MLPSCVSDDKLSSYLDLSAVCIHLYLIMTDVSPICSELLELMIYGKAIRCQPLWKKNGGITYHAQRSQRKTRSSIIKLLKSSPFPFALVFKNDASSLNTASFVATIEHTG